MMKAQDALTLAKTLDQRDPLRAYRDRFAIGDSDLIYLDGNSLGRLPKETTRLYARAVEHDWGERLIRGWNDGWMLAPERIGAKIAGLIGAQPDEVILADSTSINLFKLASAALAARPARRDILTDDLNFPSDLYILESAAQQHQERQVEILRSPDGVHGPEAELLDRLDADTALLSLTHTLFKSAFVYDMEALTARAHAVGALTLWDLSHAAGSVEVDLNGADADLAVGCTYKYLNGGPGAPAFLYVRKDLQDQLLNPISGWMGRANMFGFQEDYAPHPGLRRFLTGTPPVLAMLGVEPGVDLLLEAGMRALRQKSLAQSNYLIDRYQARLAPLGFRLQSPADSSRRGSHVTIGHDQGWQIAQALTTEMNLIPDFRAPDLIRLGIAPIYTRFEDIYEAVERIHQVVTAGLHLKYTPDAGDIT